MSTFNSALGNIFILEYNFFLEIVFVYFYSLK